MSTESENAQHDCLPQEETLLALLDSVTKENRDGSNQAARRAYHERLVTFQPATYFAKPASISPLVCARFGYVCCVNLPWERKFIAVSIDAASWAWSCSCHVATMLFPIYKTV